VRDGEGGERRKSEIINYSNLTSKKMLGKSVNILINFLQTSVLREKGN